MKFGVRKPSIKKSITARTTGNLKRTVNKTINPLYGKKGMGYINDPKKAIYNKVYNKTTIGAKDILDGKLKNNGKFYSPSMTNASVENENLEKLQSVEYTSNPKRAIKFIVFSVLLAIFGLFTMPVGILFIVIGMFLFFYGLGDFDKAKRNQTDLPALTAHTYRDENGNEWIRQYCYTRIDMDLSDYPIDNLKVNQNIELKAGYWDNKKTVRCLLNNKIIGYINLPWQRDMIFDYVTQEDYIIMAQISYIEIKKVFLRVIYYRSKQEIEREEAEIKAKYEAEKAAYVRKQPVVFDTVLVYNGTDRMQWEIQQVHKGDMIEFECDDNDRYLVSTKDAYDIGYLHKRVSDKIDALFNDGYEVVDGKIIDISKIEDKLSVKIQIILEDRNYL